MKKNLIIAVLMTLVTTVLFGLLFPLLITGLAQVLFPEAGQWRIADAQWPRGWISIDRPNIFVAGLFSLAPFERRHWIRCRQFERIESGADESIPHRASAGRCRSVAAGKSHSRDSDRSANCIGLWTRSSHFARGGGISSAAHRERAGIE